MNFLKEFKKVMYDFKSGEVVPYKSMYGKTEIHYKYKNTFINYSSIDSKWVVYMQINDSPTVVIGGYKTLKIATEVAFYYTTINK